ncbi:SRPBCC family protein [Algicella marina]|uniref:Activator of Hsp90 ATPase homologue 1/2-like C-terminal domain-containing protein n=1 Tax=Algicella marina TaxID=2683284 RepID=A0A6P1T4M4_9RHOB|nr:SRPBCC domain-containing protein [Algicella marina]QHQ35492.1 hypothetical protein GO499_09970 [Algicella marina]
MDAMVETKTLEMVKTVFIKAPVEVVWDFLTRKENLDKWWNRVKADLAAGSDYTLLREDGSAVVWGNVVRWEPPRLMETTFEVGALDGAVTRVLWELVATEEGTRLTVTHSDIPDGAGSLFPPLDAGWDQHLGDLRKLGADTAHCTEEA